MPDTILRFAPSPTGGFHVGNARTALFNYLYAKHYGATLLLRVEDTDRARYTDDSLKTILDGLSWLGIASDGEPVFQSQNEEAHKKAVEQLLASGHAYYAYETPEEIDVMRKEALAAKRRVHYNRELTAEQVAAFEAEGRAKVVRFRVPDGDTVWTDKIRGVQRWGNVEIEDFVVARSDGSPVYNLAVAVDDHNMGVTLVLRGADHLSNTPKQIMLFDALGWDVPEYGHSTLILGNDGSKLSKRHGATTVTEYQEQGFLPETLFNFLALLGWSSGDEREVFSHDELVETFSLEGMHTRDTVFDLKKLTWLNGEQVRLRPVDQIVEDAIPIWVSEGWISEGDVDGRREELTQIATLLQPRLNTLDDLRKTGYFFNEPENYDEKALKKHWKTDTPERLAAYIDRLEALDSFAEEDVEGVTRTLAGELNMSASKLIHPTRLGLCGVGFGPGLFELMAVLGQETCLRRLKKLLEVAG
ncbi:MAG: glutamate--tRNA ligase [Candidatus Latescibacteria bacterium]|jgi:glutamyl-tRNA synthetase|nr:glutamate--tRNA ligase [Candidatus Latescibacterota bacterium]